MLARPRVSLGKLALVLGAALAFVGCDAGGLLVADGKSPPDVPEVKGRSSTEVVNGGTLASNGKYKVVYVLGQPSPQQGVATSTEGRVNGGLVGATQDK